MNKDLYEKFHSVTKKHKNIISEDNYTHGLIVNLLNKNVRKKSTVLDIGCGTAVIDFYLAKKGHTVEGIDVSERAIKSCSENSRNLGVSSRTKFSVNTIEGYKNRNLFDVILLLEVIEHIKKDDQALRKIRSLLKKNGILILSTPSVNAPLHKIGFLKSFDKRVGHLRRYSTNQIETKINQSGLEVIEIIKNEGIVRNFIFTSTIGGKIILRLINRMAILRKLIVVIDDFFLKLFGESDILVIAKNP